jgi:very-short-patch-repair endonuclease
MRPDKPAKTIRRAKRLRRELTLPEAMLWRILRTSPGGHKFRKQHPAGIYVLDFFCARANLAIEIDGMAHDLGDSPAHDQRRDNWLHANRIDTIRIPARDVLDSVDAVAQSVIDVVESRLTAFGKAPPSSLRDANSPSQVDGEDQKDQS